MFKMARKFSSKANRFARIVIASRPYFFDLIIPAPVHKILPAEMMRNVQAKNFYCKLHTYICIMKKEKFFYVFVIFKHKL